MRKLVLGKLMWFVQDRAVQGEAGTASVWLHSQSSYAVLPPSHEFIEFCKWISLMTFACSILIACRVQKLCFNGFRSQKTQGKRLRSGPNLVISMSGFGQQRWGDAMDEKVEPRMRHSKEEDSESRVCWLYPRGRTLAQLDEKRVLNML